jgi:hypothetical protein
MMLRWCVISVMAGVGTIVLGGAPPAHALSMKECSAKYEAAQKADTLHGMKWNDFRKAECGANAATSSSTSPANAAAPKRESPASAGNAVFPVAVSPKYSKESAGKARLHTCLDQYNTNKSSNANGGLNWIQKGGGYYSLCNKHLKGQAMG